MALGRSRSRRFVPGVATALSALQVSAIGFWYRSMQRKRPNRAMQLTASKLAVYGWSVCRRERMLRGLAAAVDVFAFPAQPPLPCAAVPSTRRLPSRRVLVSR